MPGNTQGIRPLVQCRDRSLLAEGRLLKADRWFLPPACCQPPAAPRPLLRSPRAAEPPNSRNAERSCVSNLLSR